MNDESNYKYRNSSIDLLRLICIFLVIESHTYLLFFPRPTDGTMVEIIKWLIVSSITVTLYSFNNHGFMVISGSYGVKRDIRKLFGFWYMIWPYSILNLLVLTSCFTRIDRSTADTFEIIMKAIFPLSTGRYWYATSYAVLLLISPIINLTIEKIEKKELKIEIFIIAFIFLGIPSFLYWGPNGEYSDNYVILIVYYILVRFITKYEILSKEGNKQLFIKALLIYLIMCLLNYLSSYYVGSKMPFGYFMPFSRGCTIFEFVFSLYVVELFRRVIFYSNVISKLANYVFAIYILDPTIRYIFNDKVVLLCGNKGMIFRYVIMIVYTIMIAVSAIMIEVIRRHTLGRFENRIYNGILLMKQNLIQIIVKYI